MLKSSYKSSVVFGLWLFKNPFSAGFFTVFWTSVIEGQSVKQKSMGRGAPLGTLQDDETTRLWQLRGYWDREHGY